MPLYYMNEMSVNSCRKSNNGSGESMKKCKIKSVKLLGKQMTYNVTMKSDQHNYAIYDEKTGNSVIVANSHSASYAFLAYQTAYLKYYYPIEFMCNLLSSEVNDEDKMRMYLHAVERMKIICMPPDINKSGLSFSIEKGQHKKTGQIMDVLRSPMTMLKGVGSKAVQSIVENQPYASLEDFVNKIDARVVNVRVFTTLVNCGCMDSWSKSREVLIKEYPEIKKKLTKDRAKKQKQIEKVNKVGGGSLFGNEFDYYGKNLEL